MPGRLHILCGPDELTAREALDAIKEELGSLEDVVAGTTVLEGKGLPFGQLETACNTAPFLTAHRLVVVEGLLERFELRVGGRPARRGGPSWDLRSDNGSPRDGNRAAPTQDPSLQAFSPEVAPEDGWVKDGSPGGQAEWQGLPAMVREMPSTTVLVLTSGILAARNPMLVALRPLAEVKTFPVLRGSELQVWIEGRVGRYGGRVSPPAARLLETFVGGDLRRLDSEICKLCTFADSRMAEDISRRQGMITGGLATIDEEMVEEMVNDAREARIFDLVDRVLEGRLAAALGHLRQLMEQGQPGPFVIAMLARQVRMFLVARSFDESGADPEALPVALGTGSDWLVRKVRAQARTFTVQELRRLHRMILDADVAIKDGSSPESLALEVLICEAAALAPARGRLAR